MKAISIVQRTHVKMIFALTTKGKASTARNVPTPNPTNPAMNAVIQNVNLAASFKARLILYINPPLCFSIDKIIPRRSGACQDLSADKPSNDQTENESTQHTSSYLSRDFPMKCIMTTATTITTRIPTTISASSST